MLAVLLIRKRRKVEKRKNSRKSLEIACPFSSLVHIASHPPRSLFQVTAQMQKRDHRTSPKAHCCFLSCERLPFPPWDALLPKYHQHPPNTTPGAGVGYIHIHTHTLSTWRHKLRKTSAHRGFDEIHGSNWQMCSGYSDKGGLWIQSVCQATGRRVNRAHATGAKNDDQQEETIPGSAMSMKLWKLSFLCMLEGTSTLRVGLVVVGLSVLPLGRSE